MSSFFFKTKFGSDGVTISQTGKFVPVTDVYGDGRGNIDFSYERRCNE